MRSDSSDHECDVGVDVAVRQIVATDRRVASNEPTRVDETVIDRDSVAVAPRTIENAVVDATVHRRDSVASLISRIRAAQKLDADIGVVLNRLIADKSRPLWDDVSAWSADSKTLWSQWDRLELKDEVMYRVFFEVSAGTTVRQVIVPRALRDEFIMIVHSGVGVSHIGRTRTELAIRQRAYWIGWTSDVRRVLSACERCVRYKRGKLPHRTPLRPIVSGEPWELVSIDITGPHPTSREGFSWILTLQDHF